MVQLEEVERLFGDGGTLQDGGAALLHEGEQAAHPLPPAGGVVHLEQTGQALRFLRGGGGQGRVRARAGGVVLREVVH